MYSVIVDDLVVAVRVLNVKKAQVGDSRRTLVALKTPSAQQIKSKESTPFDDTDLKCTAIILNTVMESSTSVDQLRFRSL